MESESVAEFGDIIESALSRVVRQMETNTEVETKHEEVKIIAHSKSGAESYLPPEILDAEHSVLFGFLVEIVFQIPHIAGIKEERAP